MDAWLFDSANGLAALALGLLIVAFVPVMPVTGSYAKETVLQEYWDSPIVKRVHCSRFLRT
ncbi:MAG TPA: hypothetical protein VFR40_08450 [Lapillicoccus sp.]|nr:hypothetical protein [Lapillicoccus sp.]